MRGWARRAATSGGRAVGLVAAALATGAVAGQILGGVLISADLAGSSWRPILPINVPIYAFGIAAALRFLPTDDHCGSSQDDLRGVATLSLACCWSWCR